MKLQASLEQVKTRKAVTDDVLQTVTFSVYNATPSEIGLLNALYKRPLEIEIRVTE